MTPRSVRPMAGRFAAVSAWLTALTLVVGQGEPAVRGDVITLGAVQDAETVATLDGSYDDDNFGWTSYVMESWQDAVSAAGLIQFDLGTIPPASTILSATLTLYHEFNPQGGATFDLYRNTSSWDGTTVTYNTRPSFDSTPASSLTISDFDFDVDRTWDVTAIVRDWYSGTSANHGLTLLRAPDESPWPYFAGSNFWDAARRPRLEVTLQPVPEPAALTTLACGLALVGLATAHRRTRRARAA